MKLLQVGVPKSGNYWLYKILCSLYEQAEWPQSTFVETQPIYSEASTWNLGFPERARADTINITEEGESWFISSRFEERIDDFDAYLAHCSHVWTHSPYCTRTPEILRKFDRVIYILRDPRDVLISSAKFIFTPYMQEYFPHFYTSPDDFIEKRLEASTVNWMRHVGFHLQQREALGIHVMFYEHMLSDLRKEIAQLQEYMGLQLQDEQIEAIIQSVSFETMKADSPGHVRQGRAYGWTKSLTPEQQARVIRVAEPLLKLLNYPLSPEECATKLPRLPEDFRYDPPPRYQPPRPPLWHRVVGRLRRELSRMRS